jgi:hypothetical protein
MTKVVGLSAQKRSRPGTSSQTIKLAEFHIFISGLPSRRDYLPQQPPRKKFMTRTTTTAMITHSIQVILSPDGG